MLNRDLIQLNHSMVQLEDFFKGLMIERSFILFIMQMIISLIEAQIRQSLTLSPPDLRQLLLESQDDSQGHALLQSPHRYKGQRHLKILYITLNSLCI